MDRVVGIRYKLKISGMEFFKYASGFEGCVGMRPVVGGGR